MSKNCLCEMCYIPLYEMPFRQLCKISSRFSNPTSFRRLKDILSTRCLECLHKTSLRCLFADNDMLYVLAVFIYVPYQSLIQVNLTNVWTIASRNCRGWLQVKGNDFQNVSNFNFLGRLIKTLLNLIKNYLVYTKSNFL